MLRILINALAQRMETQRQKMQGPRFGADLSELDVLTELIGVKIVVQSVKGKEQTITQFHPKYSFSDVPYVTVELGEKADYSFMLTRG